MIEKIMFPLKLDGKPTSGTFFTTEEISLEEQISIIKHFFPYILEPIHRSLATKEMSPNIYNFSVIEGSAISSILTPKHIIKLKCDGNETTFSIYRNSDNNRISKYNVLDLMKHLTEQGENSLIYLYNNKISKENYSKIMLNMFSVLTELLFNKFFI